MLASEAVEDDLCARGAVVRRHTCSCVLVVWRQTVDLVVNKETANVTEATTNTLGVNPDG